MMSQFLNVSSVRFVDFFTVRQYFHNVAYVVFSAIVRPLPERPSWVDNSRSAYEVQIRSNHIARVKGDRSILENKKDRSPLVLHHF